MTNSDNSEEQQDVENLKSNELFGFGDYLNLKDIRTNNEKAKQHIFNVIVNGKETSIRKSTLCWLLDNHKNKLSSDRTLRVRSFPVEDKTNKCVDKFKKIDPEVEHYYAVFFTENWYIGRIRKILPNSQYDIKFLHERLNFFNGLKELVWPNREDVAVISKEYIFYGPINLIGSLPFQICDLDREQIISLHKTMKSENK